VGGLQETGEVGRASGRVGSWSGMEIWARFQKDQSLFHCYLTCISGVSFGIMKSKRNSLSRVTLECWLGFAGLMEFLNWIF